MLYLLLSLLIIISVVYLYFTRTFNYWKNRNVVGPKPVPFYGNIFEAALRKKATNKVFQEIYENFPEEKVVGVYRMTTPCLLIRDPDIVKNIMIKDFNCFSDRGIEFNEERLGYNIFHSPENKWRVLRDRLSPLFSSAKLKNMFHLINNSADKLLKHIENACSGSTHREIEVYTTVQNYSIAAISACVFGLDLDIFDDKSETMQLLKDIDQTLVGTYFINELDMMYPGILKTLNISLFPPVVKKFCDGLVKNVVAARNGQPSNRKDFMDLMLELKKEGEIRSANRNEKETATLILTDDVIISQALVFYGAGYETTAVTVAFTFYQLAINPEIQMKLIDHIDEILLKYNGEFSYDALNDMTYLNKVLQETMRMYPLEILQRRAKFDYKIEGTDVTIKRGQIALISPSGLHYDENHFPDPYKFDPERFAPENVATRHSCAYMPFGLGPRNCIGMRLGKIQSQAAVAKILSKFRIEPSRNTQDVIVINPRRIIISPLGGIKLNFIHRIQSSK